jgi:hypothetical protein
MKQVVAISLYLVLLTACSPRPDEPISSVDPISTGPGSEYKPNPADVKLTRGEVILDSYILLAMESFPRQYALQIKGSLPTPCHLLRIAPKTPDEDSRVIVEVYSVDPAYACVQVVKTFNVFFPLGSFPAGHYTLWANDRLVSEFDG